MKLTLEQARMLRKLSREEAADLIGVSSNTILNWEKGKSFPSILFAKAIVSAYELESIDDILFFNPND